MMLFAVILSKDAMIQPITILLHLSHAFCLASSVEGLGREPSTKATLFLADREIIIERFQSQKPLPSKGTETSLVFARSAGCKKYIEDVAWIILITFSLIRFQADYLVVVVAVRISRSIANIVGFYQVPHRSNYLHNLITYKLLFKPLLVSSQVIR